MILQIHREYVQADYTISRVSYAGGEFALLEPPLPGFSRRGPQALLPQQNKLFVRRAHGELRPCLPRCGRPYTQFIKPLHGFARADEVDFSTRDEASPIYFGQLKDDGMLEADPSMWEDFERRLLQALESREKIQLCYS